MVRKKSIDIEVPEIPSRVVLPGFEPGMTEPKPVVLPLHHSTILYAFGENEFPFPNAGAKLWLFLDFPKTFVEK